MRHPLSALALLAAAGCIEPTLSKFEQAPVVVVQQPGDGAVFDEGELVEFVGKVADDGPLADVTLTWIDNGSNVLIDGLQADAEGIVRFSTADLEVGPHAVALRAIDGDNLTHEASVTVTIEDVIDEPTLTIVHPTTLESGEVDVEFVFEATVADPQDRPEDLRVELTSDLDGDVCAMPVDTQGTGLCRAALRTEGNHRLTFSVFDTDGNVSTRSTIFPVDPVPEAPILTVVRPTPGVGVLQDTVYEFRATVSDRQDAPQALAVELTSDVEGFLCPLAVDPAGAAVCFQTLHTMGNQFLTFSATDPDGNRTEVVVLVRVTDSSGIDDDGDGFAETQGDCDDTDSTVYPGAPELPDVQDNDCDGFIDEGTVLVDDDGDGYCESLSQPCTDGAMGGDCDDALYSVNPAALEVCTDGLDNNCSGVQDEAGSVGCLSFFLDADGDGFGDAGTPAQCRCAGTAPWSALNNNDCNDGRADAYPGAPELADGIDNDCDGLADEGTSLYDDDGDGYCESTTLACTVGARGGGDCDDGRSTVNPGAQELCGDTLDSDCDGQINDPGAVGCTLFYVDADGDGYGAGGGTCLCTAPPTGAAVGGDCDDANPAISPTATETADGLDNDCDGFKDEGTNKYDDDGDGYCEAATCTLQTWQSTPWTGGDCNDGNPGINPGATEVCGNGVDDNCNGQQDEGQGSIGCSMYYQDLDNDGFGAGAGRCYCQATAPYRRSTNTDCYDSNADAFPGQTLWFSGSRGDGSFDYNCTAGAEKRWEGSAICRFNNPLFQVICGQTEDGWLDDDPNCGQTDTWVTNCDYSGGGWFWDILACVDGSNKIVLGSVSRQQLCR